MQSEQEQIATQAAGVEETATAALTRKEFQELVDAEAVPRKIGVSVGTIRNWTASGDLPAIRLKCGRLVR